MGRSNHSRPEASVGLSPGRCLVERGIGREGADQDEERVEGLGDMTSATKLRAIGLALLVGVGLATWMLASPASAAPPEGDNGGGGPARPVLECVSANGDGTYTAVFGSNNTAGVTDQVPVGRANSFSPAPAGRGQPTTFPPGRSVASFSVPFDGNNLVWQLNGRTSTASATSRPCGAAPNVAEAPMIIAFGVVIGGIALLWLRRGRRSVHAEPAT